MKVSQDITIDDFAVVATLDSSKIDVRRSKTVSVYLDVPTSDRVGTFTLAVANKSSQTHVDTDQVANKTSGNSLVHVYEFSPAGFGSVLIRWVDDATGSDTDLVATINLLGKED